MPSISDVRHPLLVYDANVLDFVLWDGSLTAGAVTIGGVTQSGTWTVQPGNTANTTAWKVDGSAVTQPVSAAALTSIDGKVPALGQALAAGSTPVVLTAAQVSTLTPPAAIVGFALDASIGTLNTSVNTLLKPANTLAAVTTVGTVAAQATSYGKTLTYVPVAQGAAGTTVLAAANASARHKMIGCLLTMSAAGTLKFLDGAGDLTGAMDVGATGGFVLPAALLPYQQTALNSALSLTTTGGAAKGVVTILTEA